MFVEGFYGGYDSGNSFSGTVRVISQTGMALNSS
jgi:hypothetical protein